MRIFPKLDLWLILTTGLLFSSGITILASVAPHLLSVQLFAATLSVIGFLLMSWIPLNIWQQLAWPLYGLTLVALLLPYLFGVRAGGAISWVQLGPVSFQPSELTRPFLLASLATSLTAVRFFKWWDILKSFFWLTIPGAIIFWQPDLGLTLTLVIGWLAMIFAKGLSAKQLLIGLLLLAATLPVGWQALHDYQRQRLITFLNPTNDPLHTGYNVLQSQIAVGSGQWFGRGFGRGTQSHLRFLPERHTDFIFASLAEEFGLVGSLAVLLLYGMLYIRCFYALSVTNSHFQRLLAAAIISTLMFQTFINIGMNIGLLPVTGVTLPLLSYGGSSLIATFLGLGIINQIITQAHIHQELHIH